jgi:hypothetical protein
VACGAGWFGDVGCLGCRLSVRAAPEISVENFDIWPLKQKITFRLTGLFSYIAIS